jgi:hypothetical protein
MKITREIEGKKTDRLELAAGASMTRLVDFKLSVLVTMNTIHTRVLILVHAVRQDDEYVDRYAF